MGEVTYTNVAMLQNTLASLLAAKTVMPDTPVVLSSDEEGNQFHRMFAYDLTNFEELNSQALVLIPAGEDLEPVDEET